MKNFFKNIVVGIITWEAKVALKRHDPEIIAITGSVGKTSTKDAVFAVVSTEFDTRKSEKSMNSEIGLPLTILGLENAWLSPIGWIKNIWKGFVVSCFSTQFPEWLVLEVGADHPGDIERVTKWLHPDITVLTRMSDVPVHVEYFKNMDDVLREKMFLAKAIKPGGTLVVNYDDSYFMDAVKEIRSDLEAGEVNTVFYGAAKEALVEIRKSEVLYDKSPLSLPIGQYADIRIGDEEEKIELPGVIGAHLVYPLAAACAVGAVLGVESKISQAFTNFYSPKGRMRVLKGIASSVVIDDTYNSSPIASIEALKTLRGLSVRGKKIAVLADMKELGGHSEAAHKEVGEFAGEFVHTLVTVGKAADRIGDGARAVGLSADRIYSCADSLEAAKFVADMVRAGDVVLVKGSQSMRMERVSKALLAEPEKAADLLVRQEKEWEER